MKAFAGLLLPARILCALALTSSTFAILPPVVPNDNLADAARITGSITALQLTGSLRRATSEGGEPDHLGSPPRHSVWWKWSPPSSATIVAEVAPADPVGGQAPGLGLAIYYSSDASPGFSQLLRYPAPGRAWNASRQTFRVSDGMTYYFVADAAKGADVTLSLRSITETTAPNDSFAARWTIGTLERKPPVTKIVSPPRGDTPAVFIGPADYPQTDVTTATVEPGEPRHHVDRPYTGSLWWTWTAPADGLIHTGFDNGTQIAVYTGNTLSTLSRVERRTGFESTTFTCAVKAGTAYQIAALTSLEPGLVIPSLLFEANDGPSNDNFASRRTLLGRDAFIPIGFVAQATWEILEPDIMRREPLANPPLYVQPGLVTGENLPPAGSLWWKWTAPASGPYVAVCGDTVPGDDYIEPGAGTIGVYTGDRLESLTRVPNGNDPFTLLRTHYVFHAEAGREYSISAAMRDFSHGWSNFLPIEVFPLPPLPNDNLASRIVDYPPPALPVPSFGRSFTTLGATAEPNEPDYEGHSAPPHDGNPSGRARASVWFTVPVHDAGRQRITVHASASAYVQLYRGGSTMASLQKVPLTGISVGHNITAWYQATAGESLILAIGAATLDEPALFGQFRTEGIGDRPANDDFIATAVIPSALPADGYSRDVNHSEAATSEPDETWNNLYEHERSLWWQWTPSVSGAYVLQSSSMYLESDVRFSIRQGDPLFKESARPTWLGGWSSQYPASRRRTVFSAQAGVTCWIRISDVSISYSWTLKPWDVTNDAFTSATSLGTAPRLSGHLPEHEVRFGPSTYETWESRPANSSGTGTLWWSWQAPEAGVYRLTVRDAVTGEPLRPNAWEIMNAVTSANGTQTALPFPRSFSFPFTRAEAWYGTNDALYVRVAGPRTVHLCRINGTSEPALNQLLNIDRELPPATPIEYPPGEVAPLAEYGGVPLSLPPGTPPPGPDNDNLASAENLGTHALPVTLRSWIPGTTAEDGEPVHDRPFQNFTAIPAPDPPSHSRWWRWTAPATQWVRIVTRIDHISTSDSRAETEVYAATASPISSLTKVAVVAQPGTRFFRAVQGQTYLLAVDQNELSAGDPRVSILALLPADVRLLPHDNPQNALTLDETFPGTALPGMSPYSTPFHSEGMDFTSGTFYKDGWEPIYYLSTAQPAEPDHAPGRDWNQSVWFRWTAHGAGSVVWGLKDASGAWGRDPDSALGPWIALYRQRGENLEPVPTLPSHRSVCVTAAPGDTFLIAVCSAPAGSHSYRLSLRTTDSWQVWQHQRGVRHDPLDQQSLLDFLFSSPATAQPDSAFGPQFTTLPDGHKALSVRWRNDIGTINVLGFLSTNLKDWVWADFTQPPGSPRLFTVPNAPRLFFHLFPHDTSLLAPDWEF